MLTRMLAAATAVSLLCVFAVTPRGAARWTSVTPMTSPAPRDAGEPGLVGDGRGRVWLSWLEPAASGITRFRMTRLGATAATGTASTISEGANYFVNWADVPAVFRAADGTFVAHWLQRRGASREAYDINLVTSKDEGVTWSPAGTPHRDGKEAEHGFVSYFNDPRGGVGMVWLDGRQMAGADHMASMPGMATMLRTTRIDLAGSAATIGNDGLVDARVCDCCSTSAAVTSEGVIVAYRDRGTDAKPDSEIRDISVSRFDGKTWSVPARVHADNWDINACPVNGPVISASGKTVAVAWFTQNGGTPHNYLAFSRDGGRTFGARVKLDAGVTLGRLGMVMPDASSVIVAYMERVGEETALFTRVVGIDGTMQPSVKIAKVGSERASGFPRLVIDGDRVVIAWTAVAAGHAAGIDLASLR